MKTQMFVLMFIICANVVSGFVMNAQTEDNEYVFPGVEYSHTLNQTGDVDEYEDKFNATELIDKIQPQEGILAFTTYVWNSIMVFADMVRWIFDGFAMMIDSWAGFIPTEGGITIVREFGNILRVLTAVMFATLLLEFTRGVQLLP